MKKVAIVVPVYNEEDNLQEFYRRITEVMETTPYEFKIFFVNDGSSDDSAEILAELSQKDARVEAFLLSRNYGHQLAITCGLDNAEGDCVITMDGDLQHPPEMLPQMLDLWEQGYEIVQTRRLATQDAGFIKNLTSSGYYKFINAMSKVEITPGGSDFRLMDRIAVDALKQYRESARFIRGLVKTLGFKTTTIDFVAPARFAGVSKFNMRKMLHFALDGIMAFSNLPLRWAFYAGLVMGAGCFILLLHVLFSKFISKDAVPGWSTIMVCVLFFSSVQLLGIGILGEYIGRIFEEVKRRPLYLVARHVKQEQETKK